jgi:hypothetical protein
MAVNIKIMAVNIKIMVFLKVEPYKLFRGFSCPFSKQQKLIKTFSVDGRKKERNYEVKEEENQQRK